MITPFLLYLGRASLYMAVFYAFFLLVMRKTSFFRLNRAALLLGTIACHVLPLLRLRTVFVTEVAVPEVLTEEPVFVGTAVPEAAQAVSIPWLTLLYAAGVTVVLAMVLVSVWRTLRLTRDGEGRECEGYHLTLVDHDIPSFSWRRHIVMSRKDYEKYPAILRHELQHIRHAHSLDILLMTGVTAIHWFNPLAWIARTELALLHEYEADEGLIQQGIDATQYQLLLVRKAVGEQRFSMANGFNHAKLKQRIAMMHTEKTPARVRLAYVGVLPVLALTMFVCNPARAKVLSAPAETPAEAPELLASALPIESALQELVQEQELQEPVKQVQKEENEEEAIPFGLVDVKPRFQGGDANTFSKWVSANLVYPAEAREKEIEGRVTIQFAVKTDGSISDVKVLRSAHPLLDAEAVRIISASPKWTPGQQKGRDVKVMYQFPVIFKLKDSQEQAVTVSTVEVIPMTTDTPPQTEVIPMTVATDKAVPFSQASKKPGFQGGDANTFAKWVSDNLNYPEEAKKDKIAGRVMLQFVVGTDGSVSGVKVLRGVNPLLDEEAVRVISSSPNWTPGELNGEIVAVTYQFPVIFQLR